MDRREFLATTMVTGAAATALASEAMAAVKPAKFDPAAPLIRPRALSSNDTVGIIAPSSAIADPDDFAKIEPTVAHFGLKPKYGEHLRWRSRNLAASIEERVRDIHGLFADQSVKAIFCARGGYGASEIVAHLDYDLIRRNPKVFVGYSDITVLHQAIRRHAGLMTFHGPMPVASPMTDFTADWFRKAVFEARPLGRLGAPAESRPLRPTYPLRTVVPGQITAPIVGGNLSMIIGMLGTPYELDTTNAILFIEDIDEEPYRIGRMLIQLKLAGKLDKAAGVIMGKCKDCGPSAYQPSFSSPYTLGEQIDNVLGALKVPVLSGMALGHTDDQLTIPLGAKATLDATAHTLTIEEAGVV
jgi:muramoyltetrapeptide carboxypeptidase